MKQETLFWLLLIAAGAGYWYYMRVKRPTVTHDMLQPIAISSLPRKL